MLKRVYHVSYTFQIGENERNFLGRCVVGIIGEITTDEQLTSIEKSIKENLYSTHGINPSIKEDSVFVCITNWIYLRTDEILYDNEPINIVTL